MYPVETNDNRDTGQVGHGLRNVESIATKSQGDAGTFTIVHVIKIRISSDIYTYKSTNAFVLEFV